jgi:hypothetical protein
MARPHLPLYVFLDGRICTELQVLQERFEVAKLGKFLWIAAESAPEIGESPVDKVLAIFVCQGESMMALDPGSDQVSILIDKDLPRFFILFPDGSPEQFQTIAVIVGTVLEKAIRCLAAKMGEAR